ncbi:FAD-dependent oxidoreductase, partial [Streptomyces sp. WM6386]|uniref:FAD-dependent oxidoreductase n=1 Tax=Streptomyces sp. WM6386 TaxID=1415558 RepID=UPI0019022DC9
CFFIEVARQNGGTPELSGGMVLLACGTKNKPLFPDERSEEGRQEKALRDSEKVQYGVQSSDALGVSGQDIVIIGGGDTAEQAARLFKRSGSASVTLLTEEIRSRRLSRLNREDGIIVKKAGVLDFVDEGTRVGVKVKPGKGLEKKYT